MELYPEAALQELREIWEPKKEYIEKDLWVIRNILTEEELAWMNEEANNPDEWYTTMRSPYGGNIKNKFLGYIAQYNENGEMLPPHPKYNPQHRPIPFLYDIELRLASVLPKHFAGAGALQSFFEVPEDQIIKELGSTVDFAMDWHYERDEQDADEIQRTIVNFPDGSGRDNVKSEGKISASFNVYINDNFDGGILEFKNKQYSIKPEPGMLVHVPLYREFEHRVTKVTNGNRHTLYGRCWDDPSKVFFSSKEDC